MSIKKIMGQTFCRSDFDLLSGVYGKLAENSSVQFEILVSGAHLSRRFGMTVKEVRKTGIPIAAEIPCLFDSDQFLARPLAMAHLIAGAMPLITRFEPDLLLAVGDREDTLAMCIAGAYLKIPTVHFFGGDHGVARHVDTPVRHACSKLASMHFVSHEEHAKRLVALGEPPSRIHVVGNPALDIFQEAPYMSPREFSPHLGCHFDPATPYAVVVHHPTYAERYSGAQEIEIIFEVLHERGLQAVIGLPNTDAGAREVLDVFKRWQAQEGFSFYQSLDRVTFVNLLRNAQTLIGNSSMGLLEAPSIPLPVVNVGERQRGRTAAENVLFVDAKKTAVARAVDQAVSGAFRASLQGLKNPYGNGESVKKIIRLLNEIEPDCFKTEDPLEIQRTEGLNDL